MPFLDLNEDVLGQILSKCDIYTVLCVGRVNRYLRLIVSSKQLWISLLGDLELRGFLDFTPEEQFQSYSTADLIDEIKCISLGPKTWSPTWSAPQELRRHTIVSLEQEITGRVELLPGGKYIAIQERESLGFYEVPTGQCVHTVTYTDLGSILNCSFHMRQRSSLEVAVSLSGPHHNRVVQILRVDLLTGHSDNLLRFQLPTNLTFLSPPTILGKFFAIAFGIESQAPGLVLLVNWCSAQYVLLNCPPFLRTGPILLPGHLGITYADLEPPHQQILTIHTFDSLASFWRPISGMSFWDRVYSRQLSPVVRQPLEFRSVAVRNAQFVEFRALENPVRPGIYEIIVHAKDYIPAPQPRSINNFLRIRFGRAQMPQATPEPQIRRSVLFSYSLDLSGQSGVHPAWRLLSAVPADLQVRGAAITFSHYCVDRSFPMVIDALPKRDGVAHRNGQRVMIPYQRTCKDIFIAPYSGAVVSLMGPLLSISYYV
ncbi:hypothetical protein DFH07DRAFT_423821 [Mycena maculata]|uniref:F-box domain-containing protein n=1 Tax=Mycena maculata TaxID=230809 RepID=A0AAD7JFT4_9AGAR|nr:hypothetical protein DFH07DRAFT_423821 [Mycena maculata]